jgi:hypothetical protein
MSDPDRAWQAFEPRPVRLRCFPREDAAFADAAGDALRDGPAELPETFEARLRARYPHARVHTRALSGEPDETGYIYRDGHY